MTCVLTPDGEPFFAGTYFPAEPRQGMPAFTQVLQALADAWENRRDEVARGQRRRPRPPAAGDRPRRRRARRRRPRRRRGDALRPSTTTRPAGSAPAPSSRRRWCWSSCCASTRARATHARSRWSPPPATRWRAAASTTSSAAASRATASTGSGGSRTSRRCSTTTPSCCASTCTCGGSPARRSPERVARETARFIVDELGTAEGGFASALDADSDGHEGTFYVWNPNQLMRLLGAQDGAWAAKLLGVTGEGTFERGFSTLQLLEDPDDPDRWADVRARLLAARAERTRPARDDKVVAAWNGLAITALAEASVLLDDPSLGEAAVAAAHAARRRPRRRRDGQRVRAGVPRRVGRTPRRRARGPRLRRRGVHRGARHHRRPGLARPRPRAPRRRARTLRRTRRRLLRHRGRRRGPGRPAAGRLRQRLPVGHVGRGGGARGLRRGHRRAPLPRGSRGRARVGRRGRASGAPLRRLEPGRRRGDARRPGRGRRRRPATGARRPAPRRPSAHHARCRRGRRRGRHVARAVRGTHRGRRRARGLRVPRLRLPDAGDGSGRRSSDQAVVGMRSRCAVDALDEEHMAGSLGEGQSSAEMLGRLADIPSSPRPSSDTASASRATSPQSAWFLLGRDPDRLCGQSRCHARLLLWRRAPFRVRCGCPPMPPGRRRAPRSRSALG